MRGKISKADRRIIIKDILKQLTTSANIEIACNMSDIHRSTFYRWMEKNHKLKEKVDLALKLGRDKITDFAESNILTGIRNGDLNSSKFWLTHNSERYKSKGTVIISKSKENNELSEEELEEIERVINLNKDE